MPADPLTLTLPDEAATDRLGRLLADTLRQGDTLLLQGPIGAGKTHLARALIRARSSAEVDVPSPSFTLVQPYDTPRGPLVHADLYRLTSAEEAIELGLAEQFGQALCLVEWPDRLGAETPAGALTLSLSAEGDGRLARFSGPPALLDRLAAGWVAA